MRIKIGILLVALSLFSNLKAQNICNNINLWVNGTFEDTTLGMACSQMNPINVYYIKTPPWNGVTTFINRADIPVNTAYLDEPDSDHTTGTAQGHYFYCDPRDDGGWTYQIEQTVKVQPNTTYTFSTWIVAMLQIVDSDAAAVLHFAVNGSVIAGSYTIRYDPSVWKQYSGTWFSGTDTTALIEIDDDNPVINGNDFGLDDIYFGAGILKVNAGKDTSLCISNPYSFYAGGKPTALYGATCSGYTYQWLSVPSSGISFNNDTLANPQVTISSPNQYQLVVKVTDMNNNTCFDTAIIKTNNGTGISSQPSSATICAGTSITLTASGGSSYTWSPASELNVSTGDSVVATPTANVTYTVSSGGGGCSGQAYDTIEIIPAPNVPTISQRSDTLISSAITNNQWYRNDTLIPGATTRYLVIGNNVDLYRVTVTNPADGCSNTSPAFITSGIYQIAISNDELTLYPNPTNSNLYLTINSSAQNLDEWNLAITDVLGQTLLSRTSLSYTNEINLSNLATGVYFVIITNSNGKAVIPVVKQN